jgi:hypothetical protein
MTGSLGWPAWFRCSFDPSQSRRFPGSVVRLPQRSAVPRTPQRFQTHQLIKLCRGRESALNRDNSCKILIIPGKRLHHERRSQTTFRQYFTSFFVAVKRLVCNQEVAGSIPLVST